jgi:adenylosuccinate synthase
MAELVRPRALRACLEQLLPAKNEILEHVYGEEPFDLERLWEEQRAYGEKLGGFVVNATQVLKERSEKGSRILFEGAQGALLDIDLGTYPYVTSSNTCLSALGTGCGFSPRKVAEVLGVVKAYSTRVGEGPFPSEAAAPVAEALRERGAEYGATTGRPRRCGWLDMVALKHALWTSDVDSLVLTKLDVLDELPEIRAAVAYGTRDGPSRGFPSAFADGEIEVQWRSFPGWRQPTDACRTFEELPGPCRAYVSWISRETARPIRMISVGGERDRVIRFDRPFWPDRSP